MAEALTAEHTLRFDVAIDRLYRVILDHPDAPEVPAARLQLARLLALAGEFPGAILECQALRNALAPNDPIRTTALRLASLLARRLRLGAGATAYPGADSVPARGLTRLDEPSRIAFGPSAFMIIVDPDGRRIYRVEAGAASEIPNLEAPSAAAILPSGDVVIADRNGLRVGRDQAPRRFTVRGSGGERPLRSVRSMAANSTGDLFAVEGDDRTLVRCAAGATSCVPWGPGGRVRRVRVDAANLVYVLRGDGRTVHILSSSGEMLTEVGPQIGSDSLREVVDLAVDGAYGLYLLDRDTQQIQIVTLRASADNRLFVSRLGTIALPTEGVRALRDPSALGVGPSGEVVVAGESSPRLLRFN